MSTSRDEERLLSDSSVTDIVGNQVDDVGKQLVIENAFAEELEEEEKKGDSVGIDVPSRSIVAQVNSTGEKPKEDPALVKQANEDKVGMDIPGRSIIAQVNPTGEKPKAQVEDTVGIEVPGRSVIACVDPAKQKAVDTPLPHDPYQVTGPLSPDPYQPATPLYNPTPSTSLPPEGGGVMMKTTPLDDRSTAVLLVCSTADDKEAETQGKGGEKEEKTQIGEKEQEEARTQESEKQGAKTQKEGMEEIETRKEEEEQEEVRTQEKEEQEAKIQKEGKEEVETQNDEEEQEEAGITERQQETIESPPTYEEATDNIPEPESLPEAVEAAVDKVGANEFQLFFHLMEKDAELPEGDYAFNCSCSCNCGKSCGKCVMGYQFNKIKVASLKEGPTTAAIQWNDRKCPNVTLLFKFVKVFINIFLFLLSLCNFSSTIYQSTQKGQFLFDVISTLISLVGSVVSTTSLLVFLVRRCEEVIRSWRRLFSCVHAMNTVDRIRLTCCGKTCTYCCKCTKATRRITDTLEDRMKGSRCCGCWIRQLQRLNRLKTTRGKWITIVGNFSEIILTVFGEIISTVNIVLSLYTFIGKRQYRVFYIVTELSEITTIIFIILSFILFLISHIDRIRHIAKNIYDFDKDMAKIPEEKLKRNFCQRLFGFQGRLVIHAILLSLLQIWCMLALAWKIIRDHCISEEEVETTTERTVIGGRVFTSTLPTAFEFGPLRECSVPSLQPATVNIFTMYNIFYVTVLLPILSYVFLFVSNMPFFVEYSQLLHVSGICKFERAVEESKKEEAEKGVTPHHYLELLSIFFQLLNPKGKFSEEDLKNKKEELKQERKKIEEDIINGTYAAFGEKIRAIITFLPTIILGVFHFALFFLHISFLACRYSPQFGVACSPIFDDFSVFTQSLPADKIIIILPAIILFFLTGFPGPFVTIMWIGILVGVIMLVGSVVFLIALVCLMAVCAGSNR